MNSDCDSELDDLKKLFELGDEIRELNNLTKEKINVMCREIRKIKLKKFKRNYRIDKKYKRNQK